MRARYGLLVTLCACSALLATGCGDKSSTGPSSGPLTVTTVGSVDLPGFAVLTNPGDIFGDYPHEPCLYDGTIYIPAGVFAEGKGILMVDVNDPSDPALAGSYTTIESRDVAAENGLLLSVDTQNLHVLDATNPQAPVLLATQPMGSGREAPTAAVTMDDTLAFVTGGGPYLGSSPSLQAVSIADPENPIRLGASEETGGTDVVVSGSLAYVSCYEAGLRIYDVSDPDSLELLSQTGTFGTAAKVQVEGSLAYLYNTGYEYSLAIIDVSSPSLPVFLSATPIPSDITGDSELASVFNGIRIDGDLAFLSTYGGTAVVDVSDPAAPVVLGGIGPEEFTGGVEIVEGNVAVVSRNAVTILHVEVND